VAEIEATLKVDTTRIHRISQGVPLDHTSDCLRRPMRAHLHAGSRFRSTGDWSAALRHGVIADLKASSLSACSFVSLRPLYSTMKAPFLIEGVAKRPKPLRERPIPEALLRGISCAWWRVRISTGQTHHKRYTFPLGIGSFPTDAVSRARQQLHGG
jgi:hypothetical protein